MAGERALASLASYRKRYRQADRAGRSKLLDAFCETTGYHRKYAITLFARPDDVAPPGKTARRRGASYGPAVARALETIWQLASCPWSVRLKAMLPQWLPHARKHIRGLSLETEQALLKISPRQMDRLLASKKRSAKRRLYGRTKPGKLLKTQIPIRTDNWDVKRPGYLEIDTVAHCGPSASGQFIHSLNMTDIHTGWTETRAVMGKGETGVTHAIEQVRLHLPFDMLAIDSDNGSEFINHHLVRWCASHKVDFTRSRAGKKNDNAYIEQKNWTHVRRILGWERYDDAEQCARMNELYRNELRFMQNLFQPCVKLIEKTRVGSKVRRRYDAAKTPLDRLIAYYQGQGQPVPLRLQRLISLRDGLDPFALSKRIDAALERLSNSTKSPRRNEAQ